LPVCKGYSNIDRVFKIRKTYYVAGFYQPRRSFAEIKLCWVPFIILNDANINNILVNMLTYFILIVNNNKFNLNIINKWHKLLRKRWDIEEELV